MQKSRIFNIQKLCQKNVVFLCGAMLALAPSSWGACTIKNGETLKNIELNRIFIGIFDQTCADMSDNTGTYTKIICPQMTVQSFCGKTGTISNVTKTGYTVFTVEPDEGPYCYCRTVRLDNYGENGTAQHVNTTTHKWFLAIHSKGTPIRYGTFPTPLNTVDECWANCPSYCIQALTTGDGIIPFLMVFTEQLNQP